MTNPGKALLRCLAGGVVLFLLPFPFGTASAQDTGPDSKADRGPVIIKYDDKAAMGTRRITDDQGRKYILYSTGGPSEGLKSISESAREDKDKAWEMLSTIIIDTRSYLPVEP